MALTLDRKAFIDILSEGEGTMGGAMLPPPDGVWGLPPEMLKTIIGYGDVEKAARKARELMKEAGYGPDKRLKIKVSTRNIATFRDPAAILIDQLRAHLHRRRARDHRHRGLLQSRVQEGLRRGAQPHRQRGRRSRRHLLRGLRLRLAAQLQQLLQSGDDQAVRGAVARDSTRRSARRWCGTSTRKLQEDIARPIISHGRAAGCWQPHVKNVTIHTNSIYNGWRFEDVWLDR